MGLTVPLEAGRLACLESIEAFRRAAATFDEYELLGESRCHGWTRLDVVVHVVDGWQEMLGGLVSRVDAAPTVDAASYWSAFAEQYGGADAVLELMAQRRRAAAYGRPSSAMAQLDDVGAALCRGVDALRDGAYAWQGQVFAAGDFAAVWVVENAIHQLDLRAAEPVPDGALAVTRATIEARLGEPLPPWSAVDAVLIGTGRSPVPPGFDALETRLPTLG